MLLGNCTVGRCFYLSMTEQSTDGNVSIQRQRIRCVAGIKCCYSNSSGGEHYKKKGTYFSGVIKLFVHKVQVTSLGYVTSGVENNQKQTYRMECFMDFAHKDDDFLESKGKNEFA